MFSGRERLAPSQPPDVRCVSKIASFERNCCRRYMAGVEGYRVAEDSWKAHIAYLEDELTKIDERANKLEAMIPILENEQKKHSLQEHLKQLRDEASERRKYLLLVKHN